MIWENGIETCIISYMTSHQSRFDAGYRSLGLVHWDDPEGEFEQAPGVDEGQGRLACCSPWGRKKLDTTEQLN